MPHKCARCGKIYEDASPEIIEGCGCGSRVFLYLREDAELTKKKTLERLKEQEIEDDDLDWIEERFEDKLKGESGIIRLDIENLLRLEKGKYRLDLTSLMRGDPLIVKAKEGVYYIDIAYAMRKRKK